MKIEIKNRFSDAVIVSGEFEGFKDALTSKTDLIGANLSGADLRLADLRWADLRLADLRWADLSRANLSDADLSRADLSDANLSGATLSDANLIGADLRWSNLRWSNLIGADLRGANLRWSNLSGADLSGANLSGANLSGATLSDANLSRANLSDADLSRATGLPEIEKIAIKDAICANVCATPKNLNMNDWHTCDTIHCIAGWATVLHPQGQELEKRFGTSAAAALIFNSCEGYVPNFNSDNETTLRWLRGEIERN